MDSKPRGAIRRATLPAVLLGACLFSGCINAGIYEADRGQSIVGKVTPRARWKASGNIANPEKAIDGDLLTFALNKEGLAGAWLTIDLGKQCLFNLVIVDHGHNQEGFSRQLAVYTSTDGKRFTLRHTVPGKRRVTTALLPHFVLARYVKFKVIVPGDQPWSVAEIFFQ